MHRWLCRSIFIRFAVVASQICEIKRNSEKIQTYSNSRSSTLLPIESAYASSAISLFTYYMASWSKLCSHINAMSAFMLHMHTERHSFNIYANFTSKLGQYLVKRILNLLLQSSTRMKKFRPWIAPKCVWRPGSARARWELKRSPRPPSRNKGTYF